MLNSHKTTQAGKWLLFVFLICAVILQSCAPPDAPETPIPSLISAPTNAPPTRIPTDTAVPDVQTITTLVSAAQGGTLELSDGAALRIPPGALSSDTEVVLRMLPDSGPESQSPDAMINAGMVYEIDLGNNPLQEAITLEIPFDPTLLPNDVEPDQVFLTTFDEQSGMWLYAGGTVDLNRNVVTLPVTHASIWKVTTWNWTAWPAILNKVLKGNIVGILDAVNLLTEGCEQSGSYVRVEVLELQNLLQGCIDQDDQTHPKLRLVNPRSIYYEVLPMSGGRGYPLQTMLGPADSLTIDADTNDPSPLVIRAMITEKSSWYLVGQMILAMLPGLNQINLPVSEFRCLADRLHDLAPIYKVVDMLWTKHDGVAAAEILARDFYSDSAVMRRFITMADDCKFDPARTWSYKGLKSIASSTSTIMSATDYIATTLSGNVYGEVAFHWEPIVTPTEIPEGVQGIVNAGQAYCRYGPGKGYLEAADLFQGDRVQIEGRYYGNTWLWVKPEKLDRHCWAAPSVLEITGDVSTLEFVPPNLPFTSDASPVTGVTATRDGNMVRITWNPSDLASRDLRGYLLEVQVCQNGAFLILALNAQENFITIQDDEGCSVPSSGVIYVASVRGYSQPVQIAWP